MPSRGIGGSHADATASYTAGVSAAETTGRPASSVESHTSGASIIGPVPSATARSTTLRSSRTLLRAQS